MTSETDKLKRRIAELEREAALHAAGGDPRRAALLRAGVPADRLDDASKVFKPSGNASADVWKLDELTGPVDSLAREWLSTRPWFGAPEVKSAPDESRPHIVDDRMVFPDGSSLPVDMMGADDLLSAAGAAPKPVAPEPKPGGQFAGDDHLSDADRDWRDAGATPKAAS